jgi:lipoprotein-anchoring transpeptidase ErfK/SrfK
MASRRLIFFAFLAIFLAPAVSRGADYTLPAEPKFSIYKVSAKEERAARKAKVDILAMIFGKRAETVARFNRIDGRFVFAGRRLKVPDLPEGVTYTPMPTHYAPAAEKPKCILIDLKRQFLGAYENGRLVASYPISSGRSGHGTPVGNFQVSKKDPTHKSSKYPPPRGGWPMPNALRFYLGRSSQTWFWIHAGDLVGRPDSHGCVRLFLKDSKALYDWTDIGTPVKIVRSL